MNKDKLFKNISVVVVTMILISTFSVGATYNTQSSNQDFKTEDITIHINKLEVPMNVNLSFLEIPSLNKKVNLIFVVTPLVDAPNTTIQIKLPEGIQLISGESSWNGNIKKDETMKLDILVEITKEGNYTIGAMARSYQPENIFGKADILFISVSNDAAIVSKEEPIPPRLPMDDRVGNTSSTGGIQKNSMINIVSSDNTITVHGKFEFIDDRGIHQSIKNARVVLFDADLSSPIPVPTPMPVPTPVPGPAPVFCAEPDFSVEQELDANTTDDQGNFQFKPVNNIDKDGTTLDIFVRIYTNGPAANVVDNSRTTYAFRSCMQEYSNVASGSIDIGTTTGERADAGAYNIYNAIDEGYRYLTNFKYTPPSVTTIWYSGNSDGTYVDPGTMEIHLRGILSDMDEWDEDVILHEYGHFIMRSIYGEWIPDSGGNHGWNQAVNVNLAMSEGWATFFQGAIQNDEIYMDTRDGSTEILRYSLEPQEPKGEDIEGAVACALWDIYDPANENIDKLALDFDEIWDVFNNYQTDNHHIYNIHEFWNGWFWRPNDHEEGMKSVFNSHGMPDYPYPMNIISPTKSSPSSAGAFDGPNHLQITIETIAGNTPITGLTNDEFTTKIGGKTAISSLIDTSIPGRYIFDVTPPQQESPGRYDLEISLKNRGADIEKEAVIYTKGQADVMLVIDRSGSMYGQPMTGAKTSAKLFTDYMRDRDKEGIVSFSSSARYDYHLTDLTPVVKTEIKSKIDNIYAGGSTGMGYGLRYGYNDLLSFGDVDHPWAMVLLSDGYHNTGTHPNNVLPDIKNHNIRVYTIGLGSYVDKDLMEHIASETGGKYYYSPTSSQLQEIYNSIIGEVIGWGTVLKRSFTIVLNQAINIPVWIDAKLETTFGISWGGSNVELVLYKPDGTKIDITTTDPNIEYITGTTYKFYRVKNPDIGEWKMEITGKDIPEGGETVTTTVRASTRLIMASSTDKDQYNQGETVKIVTSLTENGVPITEANIETNIILPDSSTEAIILYDDGGHGDGMINDGVYANYFVNTLQIGDYKIKMSATGDTSGDNKFIREDELLFKVNQGQGLISLSPDMWSSTLDIGQQLTKTFSVDDPPTDGLFPVNEDQYAEYDGNNYLVYNESSIGEEPDYIIPVESSSTQVSKQISITPTQVSKQASATPNTQVSKWVSITATSLQTASGDVIDKKNIIVEPNLFEVPLAGSNEFGITIKVPSGTKVGDYSGKLVATAITGSDSIDIKLKIVTRQGGVSISIIPRSNNIINGNSVIPNIKINNTQNVDDHFRVYISIDGIPTSSRADLGWFNWTEKFIDIKSGENMNIPINIMIPTGITGTKAFRARVNSTTSDKVYALDTGYLKIS